MLTVQYAKAQPGIKFNAVEPGFTATDLAGARWTSSLASRQYRHSLSAAGHSGVNGSGVGHLTCDNGNFLLAFERVAAVNERLDRVAAPECVLDHQPAHLTGGAEDRDAHSYARAGKHGPARGKLTDFHARLPAVLPPQLGQLPALLAGQPAVPGPGVAFVLLDSFPHGPETPALASMQEPCDSDLLSQVS